MIRIVTDSASNLPRALLKKFNITVIPLNIHIGDRTYLDGEFESQALYQAMRAGVVPTTSQAAPGKFLEVYRKLAKEATSIISIHLTSHHSGVYQSAMIARQMVPHLDIEVVDSKLIAMGTGFLVLAAAKAAQLGKTKEEILALLEEMRKKVHTYATVSTLKYLRLGGRVSHIQELLGTLLNVKPILTVHNGVVELLEKVRTRRRALERIVELTCEAMANIPWVDFAVLHADALEEARWVKRTLEAMLRFHQSFLLEITPLLVVHGGPGLIGVISCPAFESLQEGA